MKSIFRRLSIILLMYKRYKQDEKEAREWWDARRVKLGGGEIPPLDSPDMTKLVNDNIKVKEVCRNLEFDKNESNAKAIIQ